MSSTINNAKQRTARDDPRATSVREASLIEEHGELIAQGKLEHLLTDWSRTNAGLFLEYPGCRHLQPSLRAFVGCLLKRNDATL